MGGGASTFSDLSVDMVADRVAMMPKVGKYSDNFRENDIDGDILSELQSSEKVEKMLSTIGVDNMIHQMKFSAELNKLKSDFYPPANDRELHVESEEKLEAASKSKQEVEIGKFETSTKYFNFGNSEDFKDGLTKSVTALIRSMEAECTENENGKWASEYAYVVTEAAKETPDPSMPNQCRDRGHEGMHLKDFCNHEIAVTAGLTPAKVAAIRMHTGPFYAPWNKALRLSKDNPTLLKSWATCISVLYNAILKLSYASEAGTVFRGVNESDIAVPETFLKESDRGFAGGVEMAFMSTTTDIMIAAQFATKKFKCSKGTIFEIKLGAASRGAHVQWASQYPFEAELLYPPFTYLECDTDEVREIDVENGIRIRVLSVRATVSTARPNVTEIVTVMDCDKVAAAKAEFLARATNIPDEQRQELEDLHAMGYGAAKFLKKGFTVTELKYAGDWFEIEDFISARCSTYQLFEAGYSLDELSAQNLQIDEQLWKLAYESERYSIKTLKQLKCPGYFLRRFRVRPIDLKDAGYAPKEIFTVAELKQNGDDLDTVVGFGYSIKEILDAGYKFAMEFAENTAIDMRHSSCVHCLLALADGLLASGSGDNTIKLWDPATRECVKTLTGHESGVRCVVQLADGLLASGSGDNTIKVWDPATGECVKTLTGHESGVSCLVQLADGSLASTASYPGKTIKVWNSATGECLQTLTTQCSFLSGPVQLADGLLSVSGSDDRIEVWIEVWNPATGECVNRFTRHHQVVLCLLALADGLLASGWSDNTIKLWDPATGECVKTLTGHENSVYCLVQLADGLLASGSGDNTIKVWNPVTGECVQTLTGHEGHVWFVLQLADGLLASGSYDGIIKLWNPARGKCVKTLTGHESDTNCLVQSADGLLASVGNNTIKLWDLAAGKCAKTLIGHGSVVRCVLQLADGLLASGSDDKTIKVWDPVTGENFMAFCGHDSGVRCVLRLADGSLASGSCDNTIKVWDAVTLDGSETLTLTGHEGVVCCLVQLADGVLVSGSDDNTIKLWNLGTVECVKTLTGHVSGVRCLVRLADGSLASGSHDGEIKVWNPATGKSVKTLTGHESDVKCVVQLADGLLASVGENTIKLWDPATWECLQTLTGHGLGLFGVDCLVQLADGSLAGSCFQTIKVWNPATGESVKTLTGHEGDVSCLVALSDGSLASGSYDNTIKVWNPATEECVKTLTGHESVVCFVLQLADGSLAGVSGDGIIKVWKCSVVDI